MRGRENLAEHCTYAASNVLIKQGGRWRAVASHGPGSREH